jgi:hypothetical protein
MGSGEEAPVAEITLSYRVLLMSVLLRQACSFARVQSAVFASLSVVFAESVHLQPWWCRSLT